MPEEPQVPGTPGAAKNFVLVIDLGSGGPKTAVVDDTGRVAAHAGEKVTTHLLPNGGAEQDPEEWWTLARKAAREALEASGVPPEQIRAVSCTSQWSVVVPVDENGRALMRAVHWLDTRGAPYNKAVTRGFPSIQGYGAGKLWSWLRRTGMAPTHSGVDSLGHVLFIKNEHPEIYARTHKFLEPMDYLTLRLTGRCTATQHTMVPFMVVDNRSWGSREYCDPLLKLAGVEKEKMPELIPNGGDVGPLSPEAARELGLTTATRVISGINDTTASAVGAGAVNDFDGIIYIGTSAVLTCHIPFKKTDIFHMMASMPSPMKNKYLLIAEQGTGGKNLEHYLRNIVYAEDEFQTGPLPEDVFGRTNRIAAEVSPGSQGVLFLPWLNGSLAPEENASVRGAFFNLSLNSTRSHMTRAVMEGIAYNNRWALGPAERFIGRKLESFRFAGGGALSNLWAQIHADVLGIPAHRVADPMQTTIRGAALYAFNTLGIRSTEELPGLVEIDRVFEPDEANRAVYDKMYTQFRELYKRNRKIFAALNGS
jgi:xylulokinase